MSKISTFGSTFVGVYTVRQGLFHGVLFHFRSEPYDNHAKHNLCYMLNFTSFSSDFLQENNELEMWQSLLHHYYFGHIQMPSNIKMLNSGL